MLRLVLLVFMLMLSNPTRAQEEKPQKHYVDAQLTPLHRATFYDKSDLIAFYIESGVDVNSRAGNGNTPLHLAAFKGKANAARILLEHGADPSLKNAIGQTPLDIAKSKGFNDVVALLIPKTTQPTPTN